MGMTLLHGGPAHHDEAGLRAQLLDVPGPAIAHAGPETANQLVHEWRQMSLVRHTTLDAFRHELASSIAGGAAVFLPITIARAGDHGAERTHAAIALETAPLVDDQLP